MRLFVFAIIGSIVAASSAVQAASEGPWAPAQTPYSWTGFYAGIVGGYGWNNSSADFSGNAATEARYLASGAVPRSIPFYPAGGFGGLTGGYNFQSGRFVYGGEADLVYGDIFGGRTAGPSASITDVLGQIAGVFSVSQTYQYTAAAQQRLNWLGTLRGRLGYTPVDRLLVFATGGLAYGRATLSANVSQTSGTAVGTSQSFGSFNQPVGPCTDICAAGTTSQWLVGWTLGAGFEYALAQHWTARFDYMFYDLGRMSVALTDTRFPAFNFNARADVFGNIVRAGVIYNFH
jgi:outer membrane immunogenic protein